MPRVLATLAIASSLLTLGCHASAVAQPKPAAAPGGALEVVMAAKPARKSLALTTTQPARIEGIEQAPIYAKVAAYVQEVMVDFGDEVKKDQLLLRLMAPELDAAVQQRQALVAQARAQLVQAEAGLRAAEAAVVTARSRAVQAEAGIDRAETDLVRWRSEHSRISQLASSGSVNRQLVDEVQQKLGSAEASLKEAQGSIEAAKAFVLQAQAEAAKTASDIEAAKANVQVAEANLRQAQAEQSYLTLKAPFAGIVTSRQVDPGHFVQPAGAGSAPLLVIARHDRLRVYVAVPEVEAGYLDEGDAVLLEVPSLRGAEFKSQVARTSFALDATNRSLTAIMDLDPPLGRLRPGLYATAKITLEERPNVLTLPAAAVARRGKQAVCFRLVNGKAQETAIDLGIKVGDEIEIAKGLNEGDLVIQNKAAALKDGQAVEVLKQEAKKQ